MLSMKADVPFAAPLKLKTTPSSARAAALVGTLTVMVFQSPACSVLALRQLPLHAQPPAAPWSAYG